MNVQILREHYERELDSWHIECGPLNEAGCHIHRHLRPMNRNHTAYWLEAIDRQISVLEFNRNWL